MASLFGSNKELLWQPHRRHVLFRLIWYLFVLHLVVDWRVPPVSAKDEVAVSVDCDQKPDQKMDELDHTILKMRQRKLKALEEVATYVIRGMWILLFVLFIVVCTLVYRSGEVPKPRPFDPKKERRTKPSLDEKSSSNQKENRNYYS